jgi:predicted HicB family RNase H-like nuclease
MLISDYVICTTQQVFKLTTQQTVSTTTNWTVQPKLHANNVNKQRIKSVSVNAWGDTVH